VRLKELGNDSPASRDRVLLTCALASDLIQKGRYEDARDALGDLWPGIGTRPAVKDLSPPEAAEVLLQCGTLTGLLGAGRNVPAAQERAKDLLSEAMRKFRSQGRLEKAAEAQCELGACYWRLGAHDEARVLMREAFETLADEHVELKVKILVRRTLAEVSENRYHEALNILKEAEPVFHSADDALKGRWHGQRGIVLMRLALTDGGRDYADQSIIEFTAAIYHYEQAGHERYCARNLNNLAFLLYKLGRHRDAHENLDRARSIFARLNDPGSVAQVDETRSRVLIAEGRYGEASRLMAGVVRTLEQGGASALLADALTVQGVVWARLGLFEGSVKVLRRALAVAQDAGAHISAGLAAVTLMEEHGATRRLSRSELAELYRRADELLKETQDAEDVERLRACARLVITGLSGAQIHEKDFSLQGAVHELESRLMEYALEIEGGSVSRAARRLGLKHQSLSHMLTTRHQELLRKRTPPTPRKRSIIKKPRG
jgi:tetratricopeptide (TPR) repeat protein